MHVLYIMGRKFGFRLIMVNSITPTEYDPETGFWANAVNMEFVER